MKMKNLLAFAGSFLMAMGIVSAQAVEEYRGKVVDADTGNAMVSASVTLEDSNISTITNAEGEFVLKVSADNQGKAILISFLGYKVRRVPLADFAKGTLEIELEVKRVELPTVEVDAPRDAKDLVRRILKNRGEHYLAFPSRMTAFYRETIKKRRRNVSLAEAVVNVYKAPYNRAGRDNVTLYKSRKSTDYEKLDTLALKLQGGPFNALLSDIVKYPEYIFSGELLDEYKFSFDRYTTIGEQELLVVRFEPVPNTEYTLYEGELFLNTSELAITNARYSLKIEDPLEAARIFVRKKPFGVEVTPLQVSYWVDYKNNGEGWYYSYSNAQLSFKVNWKGKLFNSVYTLLSEMAVTDLVEIGEEEQPARSERLRKSIILADEASGFADPEFWGPYNIIEPEKSIESAIRKIQRQLKRRGITSASDGAALPEVIIGQEEQRPRKIN